MSYSHTFTSIAVQNGVVHKDGSGETQIWTDGLLVATMDHRGDNITGLHLHYGKKYEVTVTIEEVV